MNAEWNIWLAQMVAIMRLEIRKSFLNRRGAVVYLLALMPVALWTAKALSFAMRGRAPNFGEDLHMFAVIYNFFFLRLFVFFGCVAVFMNLFRGEFVEKTLHYYFLAPVRREVLLAGKFLAGMVAAVSIFGISVLLQMFALLWQFDSRTVSQYLYQSGGLGHILGYVCVTALACLGYGSIFVAMGMLFRNPIAPAAAVLMWEALGSILPATLQKFTIIHYLQSLSPVSAEAPKEAAFQILLFVSERTPAPLAVGGLIVLSAAVLFIASRRVRRMQIDYAAE